MKRKIKLVISLLLIVVIAISVVGCSPKSDESLSGDSLSNKEISSDTSDNESLVCGMYSVAFTYDPHKTANYGDWGIMNQIYDTLLVTDFDGITIKPGLATSWEVSEDGLKYTFHLRDDVKFHSGKLLTSADVKWTYERWVAEETASPTRSKLEYVESIDIPDDYTVVLNLTKPFNNLLMNLTIVPASILNQESVEAAGDDYGTSTVDGTGPYTFVKYIQDDRTILERNEEYTWGSEIYENSGPAHFKQLVFRFLTEPGTRLMEFQAEKIDILGDGCVFASEVEELKNLDFVDVCEFKPPYPVFIQFQLDRVPDIEIRRACNMALDREEIIQTVMGGYAEPMEGALPTGFTGYLEGSEKYYPYDLDAANKLLEDSGWEMGSDGYRYKDGKKLTVDIMFCEAEEDKITSTLFQSQMKKIGVDVTVNTSFMSSFWSHINTNEFDTIIMGLFINTPEDMLEEYLSSDNRPYPNRQSFSNPEVDELLEIAITTLDETERIQAYHRIQEIALDTALWVPLYSRNGFLVMNNRVKDFKPHPTVVQGVPKALDFYK